MNLIENEKGLLNYPIAISFALLFCVKRNTMLLMHEKNCYKRKFRTANTFEFELDCGQNSSTVLINTKHEHTPYITFIQICSNYFTSAYTFYGTKDIIL